MGPTFSPTTAANTTAALRTNLYPASAPTIHRTITNVTVPTAWR